VTYVDLSQFNKTYDLLCPWHILDTGVASNVHTNTSLSPSAVKQRFMVVYDIKIAHEACEMARNMGTNEYQIKQEVDHGTFCKFFFFLLVISRAWCKTIVMHNIK